MTADRWYHRGKEARLHGKAREIHDARISRTNRARFFQGWDDQDRFMTPQPTTEHLEMVNSELAKIRQSLLEK
jgi:hypothetical protein